MFEILPVAGALGAEINGLDLSRDRAPKTPCACMNYWSSTRFFFFDTRISARPGKKRWL